jgi:hypothetical protein
MDFLDFLLLLDKLGFLRIIKSTTEYPTQKAKTEKSSAVKADREVRGTD